MQAYNAAHCDPMVPVISNADLERPKPAQQCIFYDWFYNILPCRLSGAVKADEEDH